MRHNQYSGVWTPSRIETLRTMWLAGQSGGRIGGKLGMSRAAVIGKAHRLGLRRHDLSNGKTIQVENGDCVENGGLWGEGETVLRSVRSNR